MSRTDVKTDVYDVHIIRTGWTSWYWLAWIIGALLGGFSGLFPAGFSGVIGGMLALALMWQYREWRAERAERLDFQNFLDNLGDTR